MSCYTPENMIRRFISSVYNFISIAKFHEMLIQLKALNPVHALEVITLNYFLNKESKISITETMRHVRISLLKFDRF